jgi:hypothetical protein
MAVVTSAIIAAVGVAASVASVGVSYMAGQEQKKQAGLERQNEATRQNQMNLDAMRKKRDLIRQAQVASAQSAAVAGAQGAQESSGADGALAAISGQAGVNTLGINQNQEMGNSIFENNKQKATSMGISSGLAGAASGMSSLGGMMVKNATTIGKVGSYFSGGE